MLKALKVDFAMQRGHEMIIEHKQGIRRAELDELELEMLRSGNIPRLLPIEWFEVDGNCSFHYSLDGVSMLLHKLQREPLSMNNYYCLILGLIDALLECEDYMLRFESCLLYDQFIFIGSNWDQIKLAYLPIQNSSQIIGVEDLLPVIIRWTSYIDYIDGKGLQKILQFLHKSNWPLEELRNTVLELIQQETVTVDIQEEAATHKKRSDLLHKELMQAAEQTKVQSVGHSVDYSADHSIDHIVDHLMDHSIDHEIKHQVGQSAAASVHTLQEKLSEPALELQDSVEDMKQDDTQFVNESESKRLRMLLLAAILLAALNWKFIYLDQPDQSKLYFCLGITILLLAGAIFIAKWLKSRSEDKSFEEEIDFSFLQNAAARLDSELNKKTDEAAPFVHTSYATVKSPTQTDYDVTKQSLRSASRYEPIEPTMLLISEKEEEDMAASSKHSSENSRQQGSVIWLERLWEGKTERIELSSKPIVIGRGKNGGGYTDLARGISRLHLEIERTEQAIQAADLGSSNGSMLNGERMIPYKQYKITSDDKIQLAGEEGPIYSLRKEA